MIIMFKLVMFSPNVCMLVILVRNMWMCDEWFLEQTLLKIVMEFNEENAPILASIGCKDTYNSLVELRMFSCKVCWDFMNEYNNSVGKFELTSNSEL